MILYKYVSFKSGCEILGGKKIGYSNPWDFNDPFEMAGGHGVLPNSAFAPLVLRSLMKQSAILSLTRSPLNPLMWAHYAQNHAGFVIGWDAISAGFTNDNKNIIPAQFGNVVYTVTRPNHPRLGSPAQMKYGQEYTYKPELFEMLQRLFLYKAMCWSYEEEVRIVKCVFGSNLKEIPSGPLEKNEIDGRPLFLASFPTEAIKEIYLGCNNPLVTQVEKPNVLMPWKDSSKIYKCCLSPDSWMIVASEYVGS